MFTYVVFPMELLDHVADVGAVMVWSVVWQVEQGGDETAKTWISLKFTLLL